MRRLLAVSLVVGGVSGMTGASGPSRGFGPRPVAAAQAGRGGTIRGRITLTGALPGNPIVRMGMDPACAEMHRGERVLQGSVLVGPEGGLANVFVMLEGRFPQVPVPAAPVDIDQRGCLYRPRVVGMRVGQRLRVRNSDDVLHNVHAASPTGNAFNVGQPKAGLVFEFTPQAPEVMLKVGCDVHSWMTTYVGIVTHPFFAVTDARGAFEIASVPPGTYPVRLWHERLGSVTRTVVVTAGTPATLDYGYAQGLR